MAEMIQLNNKSRFLFYRQFIKEMLPLSEYGIIYSKVDK